MDMHESLRRIMQSKIILGRLFYDELLASHPELRPHFEEVNLSQQAVILTMQLSVIEVYYTTHSPAAEMYLKILGTKHHRRGVPREMYPPFRDVLLNVMAKFHERDWNPQLAADWRAAIDQAAEKMFEGYDTRFHM